MERNDKHVYSGALFRAAFRFIGTDSTVISLQPGDVYLVIEKTTEEWWLVCDEKGRIGYVPGNYLQERLSRNTEWSYRMCEYGLNKLVLESTKRAPTTENRALIKKLTSLRKRITRWSADDFSMSEEDLKPKKPTRSASLKTRKKQIAVEQTVRSTSEHGSILRGANTSRTSSKTNFGYRVEYIDGSALNEKSKRSNEKQIVNSSSATSLEESDPIVTVRRDDSHYETDISVALDQINLPDDIGSTLVRLTKTESGLGSVHARDLLRSILCHLGSRVPILDRLMDKIMTEFLAEVKFARDAEVEQKLIELFIKLELYKDDLQQITNPIAFDLEEITELLKEILDISEKSHRDTVLAVVELAHYHHMMILVNYYQLEARKPIRLGLIKIIDYIQNLSASVGRQLVPTVFTVECARDIRDSLSDHDVEPNYIKTVIEAFTNLLSIQEQLTVSAEEHIDQNWVLEVIAHTESNFQNGHVIDAIVNLLLAFNLHFDDVRFNIIMTSLATNIESWTNISERIMLFVNRGTDPIQNVQLDYKSSQKNSILKFLQDIYACQSTSSFLYTSDQNILVEIVLRNLIDLESDSVERIEYLHLLKGIVLNSSWKETKHKTDQLSSTLALLADDDTNFPPDSTSFKNRKLAAEIIKVIYKS